MDPKSKIPEFIPEDARIMRDLEALEDKTRNGETLVPQFLAHAANSDEELARFLSGTEKFLADNGYPTADCLTPHEIEFLLQDQLPKKRIEHAEECEYCATLLGAMQPKPEVKEEFIDQVRKQAAQAATPASPMATASRSH